MNKTATTVFEKMIAAWGFDIGTIINRSLIGALTIAECDVLLAKYRDASSVCRRSFQREIDGITMARGNCNA